MADVFGIDKTVNGSDKIVNGAGVLVSIDGPVFLVQQLQVNYSRQVNPIYELGSEDIYAGVTNPAGTIRIERAIGLGTQALNTFRLDGCNPKTVTIENGESMCGDKFGTVTSPNSVLQDVGIQATAGGATVTESATYWTGSLEIG